MKNEYFSSFYWRKTFEDLLLNCLGSKGKTFLETFFLQQRQLGYLLFWTREGRWVFPAFQFWDWNSQLHIDEHMIDY